MPVVQTAHSRRARRQKYGRNIRAAIYRAIHVPSQQKTKATVLIPVDPELQEALDAYKMSFDLEEATRIMRREVRNSTGRIKYNFEHRRDHDFILRSRRGWPLGKSSYNIIMRLACIAAGLPVYEKGMDTYEEAYSGHGLRKGSINAIAEGGGNVLQIMSISGHMSSKNVDHYVRDMERQRAAVQAMQLRRANVERRNALKTNVEQQTKIVDLQRKPDRTV
ncbi:tyrosine-type recombinase/integrase [Phyllobacterium chamaecytisi]|uniref:tyrosine-type recombinase/integrase n=1 Tax=Phyllobacterium chamaecytisi TaxID=2876082 RepID=UPI001CCAE8C3|nr:tyrosine-type recombinase/integrase [Phyllobacterium sp. KW56]MBZ9605696.1 tyrosine-type recombinase/integrase [Phyllobacterium sp. KW56]